MASPDYLDPTDPVVQAILAGTIFWVCFIIYVVYYNRRD